MAAKMVRISDARMSGTAYGTVVLHSAPEAAAGGPLALVQDGDMIEIDVPKRRLHLNVSDAELEQRRKKWKAPKPMADRGCVKLYIDHVNQADEGADPDILVGGSGTPLLRESH
jgi:dihydroxy-acid dehydratase